VIVPMVYLSAPMLHLVRDDVELADRLPFYLPCLHAPKTRNGRDAKRAVVPIDNMPTFLHVSADILEHLDPISFGDAKTAAMKVLGG
jgi:hypothetical protein